MNHRTWKHLLCACIAGTFILNAPASSAIAGKWRSLFDGKTLAGWKKTNFGGEGDIDISKGELTLGFGNSMTGITYDKDDLPKTNYELRLKAVKLDGNDFFCGITFPVANSHCSFIVGGWGGGVVGISSIEDRDASENETTTYMNFPHGKWYKIRVRVTPNNISTWINGKNIGSVNIDGRKISTRNEVDLNKPLGFSTWETRAALKDIQIREIK